MAHNKARIPWDTLPNVTALFPERVLNHDDEAASGLTAEPPKLSPALDALGEAIIKALEDDVTAELARYEPFPEPAAPDDIVISDETALTLGPILRYWRTANLVGPGHENLLTLPDETYEIVRNAYDRSDDVQLPTCLSWETESDGHDDGERAGNSFVYNAKWYDQHISELYTRARGRRTTRSGRREKGYYDNDTDGDDAYTTTRSHVKDKARRSAKLQRRRKAFLRKELAFPPANVLCTHDGDFSCGCALPLRERRAEFLGLAHAFFDYCKYPVDNVPEWYRSTVIQALIAVGDLSPLLRMGAGRLRELYQLDIDNFGVDGRFGWGKLGESCLYAYIFVNGICALREKTRDVDYRHCSAWDWLISEGLRDDTWAPTYVNAFTRIHDEVLCSRAYAREDIDESATVHYGKPYMHRLLPAFVQLQPEAVDAAEDALSQKGLPAEIVDMVLRYAGAPATVRERGDFLHPDNRHVKDAYLEWCWMTAVRCLALQAWVGCDEDGYPFRNSWLVGDGVKRILRHFADPRSRDEETDEDNELTASDSDDD